MPRNTLSPLTTILHVPLFSGCSRKDLKRVAASVEEVSFAAGRVLIEQGRPGKEAFIVRKGVVSVRRDGRKIARLGAGAIVGELALLADGPRTASVVCDTDVDVLVLGARDFRRLLDEVPSLSGKILVTLARRVRELTKAV